MSASGGAVLARRFSLGLRSTLQCCRGVCPCLCPSSHFCCRVLLRFTSSVAVLKGICARFAPGVAVLAGGCPRFAHSLAFLLSRFASVHIWRCGSGGNVRSVHVRRCGSGERLPSFRAQSRVSVVALCLGSRLLFAAWRQTGRLAISCVSIPQVEIAFVRSRSVGVVIGLCRFTSGLAVSCRRSRRVIGDTENGERGYGVGGAALVRLCAAALALRRFPWGVRWGLRAPKPAPKSLRLSGLSSRCGGIALVRIRRAYTLLRSRIGLVSLSAGSNWG